MTERPCEHCGEPDPTQSHYDGWGDWGDGVGPDGWVCEQIDGAFEKFKAWRESQIQAEKYGAPSGE